MFHLNGELIPEMFWKPFRNAFICFVIVCHVAKAVLDRSDFREKHCFAKLWNRPFGLGPECFLEKSLDLQSVARGVPFYL